MEIGYFKISIIGISNKMVLHAMVKETNKKEKK